MKDNLQFLIQYDFGKIQHHGMDKLNSHEVRALFNAIDYSSIDMRVYSRYPIFYRVIYFWNNIPSYL